MSVPVAAQPPPPAPFQRGSSPAPKTIKGCLLSIRSCLSTDPKAAKELGAAQLWLWGGVFFLHAGVWILRPRQVWPAHTTALETHIIPEPPGTVPKPSSTPEYLFNNDNIIKSSLQNLGVLQIFPVFLSKTKLLCCRVYNPTTAALDLVYENLTAKLVWFFFFFGSFLLCAASGKIWAVKSR